MERGRFAVIASNKPITTESQIQISTESGDVLMFKGETQDLADNFIAMGIIRVIESYNEEGALIVVNDQDWDDFQSQGGFEPWNLE